MPLRSFSCGGFHTTCIDVELSGDARTSCGSPGTIINVTEKIKLKKRKNKMLKIRSTNT